MTEEQPNDRSRHIQMLTEVPPGTPVITSDGKHVGKVHDIVVDANDDSLTRIVVNAGPNFPAPGFGAPKLVSVPPEEVEELHHEKIILRCSAAVFEHFPIYADWAVSGVYGGRFGGSFGIPWKIVHREKSEREIEQGASVWRVEPHLHIGDVERVLVDEDLGHVKAIVIREGHIFGHNVVLPIDFVVDFGDDLIHVQLTDNEIEGLEPFREPSEP
jgi:sporulation protein YlmC with PRC-barrel domain